jgi:hypothetical protein
LVESGFRRRLQATGFGQHYLLAEAFFDSGSFFAKVRLYDLAPRSVPERSSLR